MNKAIVLMVSLSIGGCQFAGSAGQIGQQLPDVLTASETIAINTLILRYQELQRLKMVLDGMPVPTLPPLPPLPNPAPPAPTPTPMPPAPIPPPSPVPVPSARHHAFRDAGNFWTGHRPSFRLVAGSSGISAEPLTP